MASNNEHSSILLGGPVAFKDADDGAIPVRPPCEHDAAVASLPRSSFNRMALRRYQGVWVMEDWVPGLISMQQPGGLAGRPGDVVLASLPKSGTTWLKALAFATMARRESPPASSGHPLRRLNPHECVPLVDRLFAVGRGAVLDALPSPRLMSTHMPLSVLPGSVTDNPGCKIVYICRDQKDRVISRWHFLKRTFPDMSLAEVFNSDCEGTCPGGPSWDHILGYWKLSKADPSKVLFLAYEHVLQDPAGTIRELARFLGQPFSDAEEEARIVTDIVELCSLENLRNLKANKEGSQGVFIKFSHDSYFRKGVAGDWVNHMTPEMGQRLDSIVREKLEGSGLDLTTLAAAR